MPKFKLMEDFKPKDLYAFKPSFETFMEDILLRYNWGKGSEERVKRVSIDDVKFHNRIRYGVLEDRYNSAEDLELFAARNKKLIDEIINDTFNSLESEQDDF